MYSKSPNLLIFIISSSKINALKLPFGNFKAKKVIHRSDKLSTGYPQTTPKLSTDSGKLSTYLNAPKLPFKRTKTPI